MFQLSFYHLLLLIIVANASPIIARNLLHKKYNQSIDNDLYFFDQQPLLGPSKTWRGVIASIVLTSLFALLFHYPISTGAFIALGAMLGDLISSFIKRRLKQPASSMAPLLDQIPESLLPAILMMNLFNLNHTSVFILVLLFIVFELSISRILYQLGIRKHPY